MEAVAGEEEEVAEMEAAAVEEVEETAIGLALIQGKYFSVIAT